MARILLIGSKGMLGCRLRETLSKSHEVVATARKGGDDLAALDITNGGQVLRSVEEHRPDWIVNAAAYTAVDRAESEPELAWAANATGPLYLAQVAERFGVRLLHVSTDFVFSGDKSDAYSESDPIGPRGVYGASKAAGEEAIRAAHPDGHTIVRVSWLFGPDGGNFISTMLRLGKEKDELGVVDDQRGTPTFTRDAASAIQQIMAAELTGTIHCANKGITTWHGFAQAAFDLAKISTPVKGISTEAYPTPARRPKNSALHNGVLNATIGDPMRPWQAALETYIREVGAAP